MSVITALTAQNTVGVQGIHESSSAGLLREQIDAVLSDIGVDAVKTGMLANREIIEVVSRKIKQYKVKKVVVDPVMVSKSGASLLRKDAQEITHQEIDSSRMGGDAESYGGLGPGRIQGQLP